MSRRILGTVLIWIALHSWLSGQVKETSAFDKLHSLTGDWEGTYIWSGAREGKGSMDARYSVTGNGSAVVENLLQNGSTVMTSVYHMDGADLRLTHFCAAQNQPRLKATAISPDNSQLTFSFVDITNLASPAAGHVQGVNLHLISQDHITLTFRFTGSGKESDELVDLRRKR